MSTLAEKVLSAALRLPASERAALADGLMASLVVPDAGLDARWLEEAQDRMAAYRAGELTAIDAETVFAKLGSV